MRLCVERRQIAVNTSHNANPVPVLCGAASMDSGEIGGGVLRDCTDMREATKAGLTNEVKDAIKFRRLLAFYPGGRVPLTVDLVSFKKENSLNARYFVYYTGRAVDNPHRTVNVKK